MTDFKSMRNLNLLDTFDTICKERLIVQQTPAKTHGLMIVLDAESVRINEEWAACAREILDRMECPAHV